MKRLLPLLLVILMVVTSCKAPEGRPLTKDDVIYFVMTDRFSDGNTENNDFDDVDKNDPRKYHGGDFAGLTDKLDYIKDLGTTAIWITPVVDNEMNGYHGYWAYDFEKTDEHLGTMDELKTFVEEAHKRDLKVILDYVVNHTGYNHPWTKTDEKDSWFHDSGDILNFDDQDQLLNGKLAGLPDLNTENPEVVDYFTKNALMWIKETGVDGFRLDTVRHVPNEYWRNFTKAITDKYPDFFFIGEVWNNNPRFLESFRETGIQSITDYALYEALRSGFNRFSDLRPLGTSIKNIEHYSEPTLNATFFDNHDNSRLLSASPEQGEDYVKLGLAFLMTYPGVPVIYYGTEIGLEGGEDPDNRRDMVFEGAEDQMLHAWTKKLIALRKNEPALTSPDITLLKKAKYILGYERTSGKDRILVFFNTHPENTISYEATVENSAGDYVNLLTGEKNTFDSDFITIDVPAKSVLLLKLNP